jgi:putative ABC transport system permease protein
MARISPPVLLEALRMALQALQAQLLRAVLTGLIIAIGITALVGMLTATSVMEGSITKQFSSMGATTFTIQQGGMQIRIGKGGIQEKPQPAIPLDQALRLKDRLIEEGLTVSVSDNVAGAMEVVAGSKKTNPNVTLFAADAQYPATQGLELAEGRFFSPAEQNEARAVAVLGSDVAGTLFPDGGAVGSVVRVGSKPYAVVGVTKPKGSSSFMSSDQVVYFPLRTGHLAYAGPWSSYVISIMAPSPEALDATIVQATRVMRSVRRLKPGAEDNFNLRRSDSISAMLIESLSSVSSGAALIALITLLGASIALMNIMLVSVTERTREIGTRKALGASAQIIVVQFLAEAIVVSVLGGLAGTVLGLAVGNGLAYAMDAEAVFPVQWMILALFVSVVVGIISGWYPAKKAASLDPIEALRYE